MFGDQPFRMLMSVCVACMLTSYVVSARDVTDATKEVTSQPIHHDATSFTWLANNFLDSIVQPRPISDLDLEALVDAIERAPNETQGLLDVLTSSDFLMYSSGYLTCIALGFLMLVLIPIAGFITCYCRLCGNCGGQTNRRRGKRDGCIIHIWGVILTLCLGLLITGCVFLFGSAVEFYDSLSGPGNVYHTVSNGLDRVDTFYYDTALVELEQSTMGNFEHGRDDMLNALNDMPSEGVSTLEDNIKLLHHMNLLISSIDSLGKIETSLNYSQQLVGSMNIVNHVLSEQFENIQASLAGTLGSCGSTECEEIKAQIPLLVVNIDYSLIELNNYDIMLAEETYSTLNNSIENTKKTVTSVTEALSDELQPYINEISTNMAVVSNEINKLLVTANDQLGGLASAANVTREIPNNDETIGLNWIAYITYIILIIFSSMVVLIAFCYAMGQFSAIFCEPPTSKRSPGCTTHTAANWLLAGLGFTFIFCIFFLIAIICMFATGGVMHTEVCRNLVEPETPTQFTTQLDRAINYYSGIDFKINTSKIYSDCKKNEPMYVALDLQAMAQFNIDEIIDMSTFEDEVGKIKALSILVGNVDVLSGDMIQQLEALDQGLKSAISSLNDHILQLDQPITKLNITNFADELSNLNDATGIDVLPEIELLNDLQRDYITPLQILNTHLQSDISEHSQFISHIDITSIVDDLDVADIEMNTNGTGIIETLVISAADDLLLQMNGVIDIINYQVLNEVGRCYPVYLAYHEMLDAGCVDVLYPLNSYWFSMGWCTFVLLLAMPVVSAMASIYRKIADPLDQFGACEIYDGKDHKQIDQNDLIQWVPTMKIEPLSPIDNPTYQHIEPPAYDDLGPVKITMFKVDTTYQDKY